MIWQYLQAKLQRFRDYKLMFRNEQAVKIFCLLFKIIEKKFIILICNITMLQLKAAQKKRLLQLTKDSELNNFTNMIAKIDIDALKFKNKLINKKRS